MNPPKVTLFSASSTLIALLLSACGSFAPPETAFETLRLEGTRKLLLTSGVEDTRNDTVTLPIFKGRSGRDTFWYVVTESSNKKDARKRGVNWSPKLVNAVGTRAVQPGSFIGGVLELAPHATVDFSAEHIVTPGPTGFPPAQLQPGAVGQANYTPLVVLPNGTVLNASHVANASGLSDKVVALEVAARRVTLQEAEGFYNGKEVYYVSLDASVPDAAALEAAIYAPNLNAAPGLGSNERTSARAGLALLINGQTGVRNPERQGLTSALLGEGDPLNVLQVFSPDRDYSPLWDVYPSIYTDRAVAAGRDTLQTDFGDVAELAEGGWIMGPGGVAWGAGGFIVNCPAVSRE